MDLTISMDEVHERYACQSGLIFGEMVENVMRDEFEVKGYKGFRYSLLDWQRGLCYIVDHLHNPQFRAKHINHRDMVNLDTCEINGAVHWVLQQVFFRRMGQEERAYWKALINKFTGDFILTKTGMNRQPTESVKTVLSMISGCSEFFASWAYNVISMWDDNDAIVVCQWATGHSHNRDELMAITFEYLMTLVTFILNEHQSTSV